MEFRTFRLCGCRHGTQCIPQENMKSAAGFLSVWFSSFARLFRPFSCPEARGSSYFPSEHTVYPPAFFSLCVRNSFLLCFLFVRIFLYALSLRENCLVARYVRKLPYKVLIIRRCISGRFICICRLVCGITEEWICCRCHFFLYIIILCDFLLFVILLFVRIRESLHVAEHLHEFLACDCFLLIEII